MHTNFKDAIHATLTVLPRSLWWLLYRWVKCRWYPTLLPRILPLVTPTFRNPAGPHFTHNRSSVVTYTFACAVLLRIFKNLGVGSGEPFPRKNKLKTINYLPANVLLLYAHLRDLTQ